MKRKEREISSTNLLKARVKLRVRMKIWMSTGTKGLSTWTPILLTKNPPRNPKERQEEEEGQEQGTLSLSLA